MAAATCSSLSAFWRWRQDGQLTATPRFSRLRCTGASTALGRVGLSSEIVHSDFSRLLEFSHSRRSIHSSGTVLASANGVNGAGTGIRVSKGDHLLRCISDDAEVAILALVATDVVRDAQRRHQTSPVSKDNLMIKTHAGFSSSGSSFGWDFAGGCDEGEDESVQITFLGQGPLGQMTTICKDYMVKGFVGNPDCESPLKKNGKLDVGSAVGTGVLTVVRDNEEWAQPYSGTVPIYSGEIAEDIAHYLADSEQISVALGVGVSLSQSTAVEFAGGFLVQVLPFCSEETLSKLERNITNMPPLSESQSAVTAENIFELLLEGIGLGEYDALPIPKFGPCTVEELKPRMMRAVASLGRADVKQLLEERGHVEVKCEFCAEVVQFGEADLKDILQPKDQ